MTPAVTVAMTQVTDLKGVLTKEATRQGDTIINDSERINKASIPGLNTGDGGSGLGNAGSNNGGGGNAWLGLILLSQE